MNKSTRQVFTVSEALRTFLNRTCATCKKRIFVFGPCEHCGDKNIHLIIEYEKIPKKWRECVLQLSLNEYDIEDNKRSYIHKKPSRKDLELVFRKKMGRDGRLAYEVLLLDRMKKLKKHQVHVKEGDSFVLDHDEIRPL